MDEQKESKMMIRVRTIKITMLIILFVSIKSFAQTDSDDKKPKRDKSRKGFHAGLYVGSYFANRSTATIYDGYGFDQYGMKNNFANSFMYNRIVNDYGGGNGLPDQIALALNVNHGDWSFNETDMPTKMKYNPAILVGLHTMYGFTQKDALIFNATGTKLTASGAFTITLNTTPVGYQQPGYLNVQTFGITGGEERALFQIGYRRILGDDDVFNFFIEGGPEINLAKFVKNQVTINNLVIDMAAYYNNPYYPMYHEKILIGEGLGVFGGLGLNITAGAKYNLQFVYNPSFEKINIGANPQFKWQHALGLRAYYNL